MGSVGDRPSIVSVIASDLCFVERIEMRALPSSANVPNRMRITSY